MTLVSSQSYPTAGVDEQWLDQGIKNKINIINAVASSYRLHSTAIHSEDEMWKGLLVGSKDFDPRWIRTHYFFGGRSAMRNIAEALIASEAPLPRRIMDFPCSHGRVTRFLRIAFPDAELFVGDLNYSGVDFCAAAFDAKPVYSQKDLNTVDIPLDLDLIWCSSLVTHLPEVECLNLLNRLMDSLAPGGIAGVTTCGRGMDHMQREVFPTIAPDLYEQIYGQYQQSGFGYHDYPGHTGYGMTFVDLRWIQKVVFARSDVLILRADPERC